MTAMFLLEEMSEESACLAGRSTYDVGRILALDRLGQSALLGGLASGRLAVKLPALKLCWLIPGSGVMGRRLLRRAP